MDANKIKIHNKVRAGLKEKPGKFEAPPRGNKVKLVKSKLPSYNASKKFSKWPYFTICTAPSTVKSKHVRTKTVVGIGKKYQALGEKIPVSITFKSNPRTRSNSRKAKKSTIHSTNKSIENDPITIKNIMNTNKLKNPINKRKIKR